MSRTARCNRPVLRSGNVAAGSDYNGFALGLSSGSTFSQLAFVGNSAHSNKRYGVHVRKQGDNLSDSTLAIEQLLG